MMFAAVVLAVQSVFAFSRVYEHRFLFDNEYRLPAGTYLPVAHYAAEVQKLPAANCCLPLIGSISRECRLRIGPTAN